MTQQEFCNEYGWPPAKVSRLIRTAVFTDVFGTGNPDAQTIREQPIEWNPQNGGFRVTKPAGRTDLQYEIFEPDQLETWLAKEADRPPLNEGDIDRLLFAAEVLYETQRDEATYRLVRAEDYSGTYMKVKPSAISTIKEILRRAGKL